MHFLIWVGRSDWKKKKQQKQKPTKKNHKKSRNRRPWNPGTTLKVNIHIIGLTKCTIYCRKCSCFSLWCYYDHFSGRWKELFQVKNGLTTSLLFFFFENAKNLGRSDKAKRKKKEDGLIISIKSAKNVCKIYSENYLKCVQMSIFFL